MWDDFSNLISSIYGGANDAASSFTNWLSNFMGGGDNADSTRSWINQMSGGDSPYQTWRDALNQREFMESGGNFDLGLRNAEHYDFSNFLAHPGGSPLPNPLFAAAPALYTGIKGLAQRFGGMQSSSPAGWDELYWGTLPFFQYGTPGSGGQEFK